MDIIYNDVKKDLSCERLHELFISVGWSDGSETQSMIKKYNVPFINSTLVISAWENECMIGVVRVLSDKMFRSIIYDLIVLPEYQSKGIGTELVKQCIAHYPNSEWLVGTMKNIASFYERIGFQKVDNDNGDGIYLSIPCNLFTRNE